MNRWITATLLTSILLLGFVAWQVRDINGRLIPFTTETQMQTTTTTWTSDGMTHTVSTPRNDGETVTAWVARHKEAVDALKAIYPPDN
jgi:hypothetical protein